MLDPGAGKTKATRLWVSMSGAGPPLVHLTFSLNRQQQTPIEFFRGYTGALMCDEYAGYGNVDCGQLLSCWAHARRYVEKAQPVEPACATAILLEIAKLYRGEKQMRTLNDSQRQELRQTQSREQVESIFERLENQEFRPQSPMQTAKNYILHHRDQLRAFTTDARYPIDNNPVERALRRVAVGRKNWLFLGSETGGETAAVLMSLLATCWAHRINAWAYLRDILERLPTQPAKHLDDLLPDHWIAANPSARLPDQNSSD